MIDSDAIVKDALSGVGADVWIGHPTGILDHLPCVVAILRPGDAPWPGVHERARYDIEGWAATKSEAQRLAQEACEALFLAARARTLPYGRVNFFRQDSRPAPSESGIDGVHRSIGSVTLSLRPSH